MKPRRSKTTQAPADVQAWGVALVFVYLFLEYTRLQLIFPVLGLFRPQLLLLVALIVLCLKAGLSGAFRVRGVQLVLTFVVLCGLGTLYAPNTRAAFNMMVNILTYMSAGIVPMLLFVRSKESFNLVLKALVASGAFVAAWALLHGGHGPGGFLGDENDCALVLGMLAPFAFARSASGDLSPRSRVVYFACGMLMLIGTVATVSRGGFLGLVAAGLVGFIASRNKMKIILVTTVAFGALAITSRLWLPESYVTEMRTIGNTEDSTRQNRMYFWKLAWLMFKDNPVIGVGAGNYPWRVSDYEATLPPDEIYRGQFSGGRPCHSVPFTVLSELGSAGMLLFVILIVTIAKSARRLRCRGSPPQTQALGTALLASLAVFVVSGTFISALYYPPFWHLIGLALAGAAVYRTEPKPGEAEVPRSRARGISR